MRRALAPVLAVGILGSQAGHLLVFQLRFGAAAQQVQSSGAHAYFPALAKTMLGAAAATLIAVLLVIALARILGKQAERDSAPPYLATLAVLFTVQLAIYAVQEMAESALTGGLSMLLLWGTLGQLPVAAAGALALRWLLVHLRPAFARLLSGYAPAFQLLPYAAAIVLVPVAATIVSTCDAPTGSINRRGPPSF